MIELLKVVVGQAVEIAGDLELGFLRFGGGREDRCDASAVPVFGGPREDQTIAVERSWIDCFDCWAAAFHLHGIEVRAVCEIQSSRRV